LAFGVLAVQGDVQEHLRALRRLGVEGRTVRTPEEVADVEGIIIPGGESTTIGKLIARYGLLAPLRDLAGSGRPLLGTCAGMILMAKTITAQADDQPALSVMDISVERNAFGRQIDSFVSLPSMTVSQSLPHTRIASWPPASETCLPWRSTLN
jgi:5'-phosphate synthase pdxT subunit